MTSGGPGARAEGPTPSRDRDPDGRARNQRPRDAFGRPLPHGAEGVERIPDDYAPDAAEALAEARRLLGEERPFHAHEVLEARWKTGPAEERELWQGLAQICVGLTHLQRGNPRGASALLARGADRIGRYGAPYGTLARAARELAAREPSGLDAAVAIAGIRALL
ncbi:DUF309 domain-containing protein [Planomonospora venezuelensis]|uniref:DUF309 domain-containing protein n=1 Tax=Planomonospora venezuelensis TaxID=1999 RepID=A0A841CTG3_PLAVE|nr:hypothetical protein [Planomonospora venezuelensis]GIM99780.1 hypothetical protein Pve01_14390 [Planomonospora venezuelensis]